MFSFLKVPLFLAQRHKHNGRTVRAILKLLLFEQAVITLFTQLLSHFEESITI